MANKQVEISMATINDEIDGIKNQYQVIGQIVVELININ